MKKQQYSIYLSVEQARKLKEYGEKVNRSFSFLVAEAIAEYLRKLERDK